MLKNLIGKELRLNGHPGLWAFLLLAGLMLIPQWVYYIAFIYLFIMVGTVAQGDKANSDLIFTALLPVRKKDIVTARTLTIVGWEGAYILVGAVCTIVRLRFYPQENGPSMNSNFAFFGTVFMMFAIFNAIYVAGSYKTPYRMLWPLVGGFAVSLAVGAILNTLPLVIPAVSTLFNDNGTGHLAYQLAALAVGISAYAGATLWANKKAVGHFEKVDL
jgi:ABC-2 type transport system permease protein